MNSEKIAIRNRMIEKRSALSPEWMARTGAQAQSRALEMEELKAARRVCAYLAMPREVGTDAIIGACLAAGREVCVPAFRAERGRYEPARYSKGMLIEKRNGAPEPARPEWLDDAQAVGGIDLVIVPGLAFDRLGARLGRGGGHYDRLLGTEVMRGAFRLALAFEFQLLDSVPCDEHDERMDAVVTEERIYVFR